MSLLLKISMILAVTKSVTVTNSSLQQYTHPDDQNTDTPGFKPFTKLLNHDIFIGYLKKKRFLLIIYS